MIALSNLFSGGSGGTIYAFIFGWVGTAATYIVLSELVSMYVGAQPSGFGLQLRIVSRAPISGGQYHWAAMLAPIKHQKFISYMTGISEFDCSLQ